MSRRYAVCLASALVCSWVLILPTRAGQARVQSPVQAERARVHENNKPLDRKQIERLERRLSEIRHRIDQLRQVNMDSQEVTKHLASRPPAKHMINMFIGNFYVNRGQKDDFRVSDRVVTLRRVNGVKQITGFGIVVYLEDDEAVFEELDGSNTRVEDEVYVINREDTSASIVNAFSP